MERIHESAASEQVHKKDPNNVSAYSTWEQSKPTLQASKGHLPQTGRGSGKSGSLCCGYRPDFSTSDDKKDDLRRYDETTNEEARENPVISFFERENVGLSSLKPSNPFFHRLRL